MDTYMHIYNTYAHSQLYRSAQAKNSTHADKTSINSLILLHSLADQDAGPLVDLHMYNMGPPVMILDAQSFQ